MSSISKAFSLMFFKDLRTLYRKKISLIAEIFLILMVVPLIWVCCYYGNKYIFKSNNKTLNYENLLPYINRNEFDLSEPMVTIKITPAKMFKNKIYDQVLKQVQAKCKNLKISDHSEVEIVINDLSEKGFDYTVVLKSANYHNEPFTIPNIFGDEGDGDERIKGMSYSHSTEAIVAQYCFDYAYSSVVKDPASLITKDEEETFIVKNIPSPGYSEYINGIRILVTLFSIILPLLMLVPMMISATDVCAEKESGVHTYMIIMGLPRFIFYLSHLIFAFIKMYLFVILCCVAIIVFIPEIGIYASILIFLLGHVMIAVAMVSSTLFRSSTFVVLLSLLYFCGSIAIQIFVVNVTVFDSSMAAFLCFVNPISAYYFGLQHLNIIINYNQPLHFFGGWDLYLPFCIPIFSLIFQSISFIILAFYFDYVLPIDDSPKQHPLFFIGKSYGSDETIEEDGYLLNREGICPPNDQNDLMESRDQDVKQKEFSQYFEADLTLKSPEIEVTKLVKKWSNGEIALKNVSFKAYSDQVTALLGHNGAGKSTIFGILTGFIKPTAGHVRLVDEPPAAIGKNSNVVGFCPQWNPLFPYLTVKEHLSFYASLKTSDNVSEEKNEEVLNQIGLLDDQKLRGNQLSGGMKRKLCLGMAMIGESKVLLLDEPTAGMDTMARRSMLQIIEKAKKDRAILLTTHYMDEADFLSDRIIILVNGEIVCNGSSEFLKSRFATGLVLSFELNYSSLDSADGRGKLWNRLATNILNVANKHCSEGSRIEGPINRQFNIILPSGSERKLPKLFREFEQRKNELKIESFDVKSNNLEQVFIKVTDYAETGEEIDYKTKIDEFIDKKQNQFNSCFALFSSQMFGLFVRKWHYTLRHYIRSSLPLLMVIILLVLLILRATSSTTTTYSSSDFWQKEESAAIPKDFPMTVLLQGTDSLVTNLKSNFEKSSKVKIISHAIGNSPLDDTEFLKTILQHYFDIPTFAFAIGREQKITKAPIVIYFRDTFPNGVPMALNALSNSRYSGKSPIKTTISIKPINETVIHNSKEKPHSITIHLLIVTLFPLVFCLPVFLHIDEIQHGTLHLYERTNMSTYTYWLAAYFSDFALSMIPIGLATILIFSFGFFQVGCLLAYLIAAMIISFAFLSQAYVASNIFKSGTMAIVCLISYNLILFSIVVAIDLLLKAYMPNVFSTIAQILFPTYSLFSIFNKFNQGCQNNVSVWDAFEFCAINEKSNNNGKPIPEIQCNYQLFWMGFGSGLFYTILLFIIAYQRRIASFLCKCKKSKELPPIQKEDVDVIMEKEKIDNKGMESFAICTKNLRKNFGNNKIAAVRDLSIGISTGECFGLLGANGAGKSTTFNMLTSFLHPTQGVGFVNGVNIEKRPFQRFGFCPQNNAILGDLTVYETMKLFARLNGIRSSSEVVECLMECLQLTHKSKNLAKNCSGGERRRLSLAVALITNSDVIMLDEPTAGVDPRTRRHVWDLLIALRQAGTSQLLTSHSMEECEALCTRIGFLNKGILVGIGTSQHLKHRYGNNYKLLITMRGPNEALATRLDIGVKKVFKGSKPIFINGAFPTLSWTIPRSGKPLSEMYENLIELIDNQQLQSRDSQHIIKEFSLVGTSLDEVFDTMAKKSHVVEISSETEENIIHF